MVCDFVVFRQIIVLLVPLLGVELSEQRIYSLQNTQNSTTHRCIFADSCFVFLNLVIGFCVFKQTSNHIAIKVNFRFSAYRRVNQRGVGAGGGGGEGGRGRDKST